MAKKGGTKAKIRISMAWTSFIFAIAGGAATAMTIVGTFARWCFSAGPTWLPVVPLILGLGIVFADILKDGEPNRWAVSMAIVLPSVALCVSAKVGEKASGFSRTVLDHINDFLTDFTGSIPLNAVAIILVGLAMIFSRRFVAKGGTS